MSLEPPPPSPPLNGAPVRPESGGSQPPASAELTSIASPRFVIPAAAPTLRDVALAAAASLVSVSPSTELTLDLEYLTRHRTPFGPNGSAWPMALQVALRQPSAPDVRLVDLAVRLPLTPVEVLAVALAAAVEEDPLLGRAIARLQAPLAGSRPTLGFAARAFAPAARDESPLTALFDGLAVRSGLLTLQNDTAPMAERTLAVPPILCLALAGTTGHWPGIEVGLAHPIPISPATQADAARHATALQQTPEVGLLIRSGSPAESRAAAAEIVRCLGGRPAFLTTDSVAGLGPWLTLLRLVPVFVCHLAPSERKVLPALLGYRGPMLALAGPDGSVETAESAPATWRLGVPSADERETLWLQALGDDPSLQPLARELAQHYRHGTGRIAQLGRLARHQSALAGDPTITRADLTLASWSGESGGVETLAEPIRVTVPDDALVVSAALRAELELLVLRCRHREDLVTGLGATMHARYRPGVRALFTGPSGAGKTLAAGWLSTRLGLPLYRVDLASVTSKYIGETEKNLAQLLAQAEQAEVILLFDEADSLFGKRTDIRDSNDRFANAQTNYLLQRIESYDGLVVLTSNSKARFDNAFARRLDCVLEFALPSPDERRALWLAHLGEGHGLAPAELNRLAALADLAGGHIRNAVLSAALPARAEQRPIHYEDCLRGLEAEFRKLGRHVPPGLATPT